jgi:hypothetical protein
MADQMVEVVVIGDEAVWHKLHSAPHVIKQEMYLASVESGLWIESSAHMFVPKRTGLLDKSIDSNVDIRATGNRMEVQIRVGETAPYGEPVEKGSGIYGPKHRPFIGHYVLPSGHEGYYLHPGMMGRRYIANAQDANRERVIERYRDMGHRISLRLSEVTP